MNELTEYVSEQIHEIIPSYNEDDYKEFHITPEETLFLYKYSELSDSAKAYQIVYGEKKILIILNTIDKYVAFLKV